MQREIVMECKWCLFCRCKMTIQFVNSTTFSVVRWSKNNTKTPLRKCFFEIELISFDATGECQLDDAVCIDLVEVRFEVVGASVPIHNQIVIRRFCGSRIHSVNRMAASYRVLDLSNVMQRSRGCILWITDDAKNENAVRRKEKMKENNEVAYIKQ